MHREENQVKFTERQRHSIVKLSEPKFTGFQDLRSMMPVDSGRIRCKPVRLCIFRGLTYWAEPLNCRFWHIESFLAKCCESSKGSCRGLQYRTLNAGKRYQCCEKDTKWYLFWLFGIFSHKVENQVPVWVCKRFFVMFGSKKNVTTAWDVGCWFFSYQ